jgi:hypothetical protein
VTSWKKWLAVGLGAVVLIPVVLFTALWLFLSVSDVRSNIVDFRPATFQAKAESKFFYSVRNELKYSDGIDPDAPTIMGGKIENFLVSPDGEKIAVVANGQLAIVGTESILRQVTSVDSIYRDPKPLGTQFFRDDGFQWSKDSKVLYLIRDRYYDSRGSQLFSREGELWKYDTESSSLQLVLKPFPACSYFFGLRSIYFSAPTDRGDLQLKEFDGNGVTNVGGTNARDIPRGTLTKNFVESPFYSFSIHDYEHAVLPSKGVYLVVSGNGGPEKLVIEGKSYLALTQGNDLKGHYYCSDRLRSVLLPGDRYFLLNVPYCGNYNGQLLIDTFTGKYQRLPADSVVYLTLNTETYPYYRITGGGIVIE